MDAVTVAKTMTKEVLIWKIRLIDERATYSILSAIGKLWQDGNYGLFLLVFSFSVLFPWLKLGVVSMAAISRWRGLESRGDGWHERIGALGKWSMIEVFMAALLCVMLKMGDLVRVKIEPGMYFFCASVIVGIATVALMKKNGKASETRFPDAT